MKQEAITITSAVFAGAIAKGATGYFLAEQSNIVQLGVNTVGALGFGFLAIKTKGNDTKSSLIRGAALGTCIAHGLGAIKNVFATEQGAKLVGENKFMKSIAGLNAPEMAGEAQGFLDDYGNYSEEGWDGYVDPAGNYVMYENEDKGLNGYAEDEQYLEEQQTMVNHSGAMTI
jgi:hypothetical protein